MFTLLLSVLFLLASPEYARAVCQLPITFTYFQKAHGYYCQVPNQYLEAQYGGSFSVDTNGTFRTTNDPYVLFKINEVVTWDELQKRLEELIPEVLPTESTPHTPSLFWDGRTDVFWHANAEEDTITTQFKATIDSYVVQCLGDLISGSTGNATSSVSSPPSGEGKEEDTGNSETAGPMSEENADGCAIDTDESNKETQQDLSEAETNAADLRIEDDISTQCFVLFHSTGCPHCGAVKEYIENDLPSLTNATFTYESYEVHSSDYSRRLLAGYQHFDWNGKESVPTVFIGDETNMHVLVGEGSIMGNLPNLLEDFQTHPTGCYDFARLAKEEGLDFSISGVKWGVLTAAALVDSVNPCAIAVLLILLGGLVMSTVPPTNEESSPSGDDVTNKKDSGTPTPDQRDSIANESSMHDIEDAMDSATGSAPEEVDERTQEAGIIEASMDSPEESDINAEASKLAKIQRQKPPMTSTSNHVVVVHSSVVWHSLLRCSSPTIFWVSVSSAP